jgi:hypothetical protein
MRISTVKLRKQLFAWKTIDPISVKTGLTINAPLTADFENAGYYFFFCGQTT